MRRPALPPLDPLKVAPGFTHGFLHDKTHSGLGFRRSGVCPDVKRHPSAAHNESTLLLQQATLPALWVPPVPWPGTSKRREGLKETRQSALATYSRPQGVLQCPSSCGYSASQRSCHAVALGGFLTVTEMAGVRHAARATLTPFRTRLYGSLAHAGFTLA